MEKVVETEIVVRLNPRVLEGIRSRIEEGGEECTVAEYVESVLEPLGCDESGFSQF